MKNMEDIVDRVRAELLHWFPIQCRDLYTRFYLWYLPSTLERDGGIMIARKQPAPGWFIADPQHIHRNSTVEQILNTWLLNRTLSTLPVLSVERKEKLVDSNTFDQVADPWRFDDIQF